MTLSNLAFLSRDLSRVDCSAAVDSLEVLNDAMDEAGRGEFKALKMIGELKRRGYRLILEEMPRNEISMPVQDFLAERPGDLSE